ncbi:MAG: hypothetical protein IJQ39_11695 [Thermoguttaceae bacterium]|nr:hypothetical protein [Thermoguttaceae bacterium]
MKKYFWEYLFKDEEELKQHQARLESFNQQIKGTAGGCLFVFILAGFLLFLIIVILAALHII